MTSRGMGIHGNLACSAYTGGAVPRPRARQTRSRTKAGREQASAREARCRTRRTLGRLSCPALWPRMRSSRSRPRAHPSGPSSSHSEPSSRRSASRSATAFYARATTEVNTSTRPRAEHSRRHRRTDPSRRWRSRRVLVFAAPRARRSRRTHVIDAAIGFSRPGDVLLLREASPPSEEVQGRAPLLAGARA